MYILWHSNSHSHSHSFTLFIYGVSVSALERIPKKDFDVSFDLCAGTRHEKLTTTWMCSTECAMMRNYAQLPDSDSAAVISELAFIWFISTRFGIVFISRVPYRFIVFKASLLLLFLLIQCIRHLMHVGPTVVVALIKHLSIMSIFVNILFDPLKFWLNS